MKRLYSTLILLVLACVVVVAASGLLSGKADGRADFAKWANRSARVLEPGNYNTSGTCSCDVCSWKGVQGVGNVGIGNGNVSLMKPEVIDSMVKDSTAAMNGNPSAGADSKTTKNETASTGTENYTDSVIRAPESNTPGNGSLVSENIDTAPIAPEPAPAAAPEAPVTESLYPDYDMAASVLPRSTPYSITINKPFEHIMNENPTEAAALYGKLIGLPMPGGQVIDFGVKCIGYEY